MNSHHKVSALGSFLVGVGIYAFAPISPEWTAFGAFMSGLTLAWFARHKEVTP